MKNSYYVYIMHSHSGVLYIGVTNNLERRVREHKRKQFPGFTHKYNVVFLTYFEETGDIHTAIEREKQLKGWRRDKKIALIEKQNPDWIDLSTDWFDEE